VPGATQEHLRGHLQHHDEGRADALVGSALLVRGIADPAALG